MSQLVQTRSLTPVNKLVKELFTCAYALIAFVKNRAREEKERREEGAVMCLNLCKRAHLHP